MQIDALCPLDIRVRLDICLPNILANFVFPYS
nr:MAG TPA: hypothetical protein [Caudoviricetes sp.]